MALILELIHYNLCLLVCAWTAHGDPITAREAILDEIISEVMNRYYKRGGG